MISLSKSKYCLGVQCPKMLWLKTFKNEEFDESVTNENVLKNGNIVGDLAMGLFGEYKEVPFGDLKEMIIDTTKLIERNEPIIAEASFSYDGLFCSVDILKNLGKNQVEIYEVKSATDIKEININDLAYQVYVLSKLGYKVNKASLVHIDSSYVRVGDLDINKLFKVVDMSNIVFAMQEEVDYKIKYFRNNIVEDNEINMDIGRHCFSPYKCGFWKYCTKDLEHPNVFDLSGMRIDKKLRLYNEGIIGYEDVKMDKKLTKSCTLQLKNENHIEKEMVEEFLKTIEFPVYFLDFETFQSSIPLYDYTSAYMQIPFQYSLHIKLSEDSELKHLEYLANPNIDPRRELAERLCHDIPKDVCVLAYNMGFEKGRIRELAYLYDDLKDHLMNIHDNIQDLMIPFQKKWVYLPSMQGSYSIKYVLPALYPDDESLNYKNLEGVHNGAEASSAYESMIGKTIEEIDKIRGNLLEYCKLDTYAMVKVYEWLKQIIKK